MREIIIKNRNKTDVTEKALYMLNEESYSVWAEQRLDAPWMHLSLEEFLQTIRNVTVFVALDAETGELLGMHCFRTHRREGWCYGFRLAVARSAQREGIASRMLAYEEERIRKVGYRFLKGVTATTADWSVRWHLKNGYRIIGYYQSPNDNFANYVFRKQLYCDLRHHPSDLFWTRFLAPLTARMCFMASYTATRLCKHSDGRLNPIGRLIKKLRKDITRS